MYTSNRLGDSGLYISKIILGTAGYGSSRWQDWILEEEEALPLLEHAFKVGINSWDTLRRRIFQWRLGRYYWQSSQKVTYEIPRSEVVILCKIFYAIDPIKQSPISELMTKDKQGLVNRVGLSRKHIFDAVEASCERLGTYIDVLQVHRLDRDTLAKKIMKALNDVVDRVAELAEKYGVPMATIALGWCLKKNIYPISGLHSIARIDEAVSSVGFRLTDGDSAYVEELYVPKEVIS
ncbi:Versiconal hemiacetal acetate reductase [Lachnellula subtilissima]|uniref:Versiconal hemiacetal acetate reductase n=1 Tax=Lachnellula subtilissima TaxID=602034 RepID=A0A8H8RUZ9_9HELO|nr:Versiconal hemiacetal acetate reductase [Lachnellula subtilissima]